MAVAMVLTTSVADRFRFGNGWLNTVELDFNGDYKSTGVDLPFSKLGMGDVHCCIVQSADGYVFEYDKENQKIKIYSHKNSANKGDPLESNNIDKIDVSTHMFVVGR